MRDFLPSQEISLEEFLQLPFIEDSPAWEFMDGFVIQKPMPKARHSQLQRQLIIELDIEVLSPQLTATRVIDDLLLCLRYGSQLG